LVGIDIDAALERMILWLSENFGVDINAVMLNYTKTNSGDELITRTAVISEEVQQQRVQKRKFQIAMSDEPGDFSDGELKRLLGNYLRQDRSTSKWLREILIPSCLSKGIVTREELKQEFLSRDSSLDPGVVGRYLSLISSQMGMEKNSFLRQAIAYDYPTNHWEKDNYQVRDGYAEMLGEIVGSITTEA
jgi:hypothetical protein